MKDVTVQYLHSCEKDYHILFIRKTRYLLEREGYFMKKYVFCFASFFSVCMPGHTLHTTANAANTTDDCLQILTSDFDSNSAKEFIGTQHLNITDSQYQTIRTFTLDLTEKYSSTKDKITAIYQCQRHQPESFCRRICPCRSGRKWSL